jgi:hypothetical protein
MQDISQKNTVFILLGGSVMTVLIIAISFVIPYLRINNQIIISCILYTLEFGMYCLALTLYRLWVSKIIWFGQAVTLLILLTLFKIVLATLLLFIILSLNNMFVNPGIGNLIDLLGPFVRGFVFELACIGIAAKIFETDIFDKKGNENDRIIDDLK